MKTIKLITKESTNFYITTLTKELVDLIKTAHANKTLHQVDLPINLQSILLIGEINGRTNIHKVKQYIDFFKIREEVHFRDYCQSLEKQKESAWRINMCSAYGSSWNTLMIALNQPKYCIIWSDHENITYELVRQF